MTYKYRVTLSDNSIIRKKGNMMLVWLTDKSIMKYEKTKYLHFHMTVPNGNDHLGDWGLVRKYNIKRKKRDNLYTYFKCLVKRREGETE